VGIFVSRLHHDEFDEKLLQNPVDAAQANQKYFTTISFLIAHSRFFGRGYKKPLRFPEDIFSIWFFVIISQKRK